MRKFSLGVVLCCWVLWSADADPFADHAFVRPIASKSLLEASLHPLPQEQVADYLRSVTRIHRIRAFEGRNEILKAMADTGDSKVYRVGEDCSVELSTYDLFGEGFVDGSYRIYLAGLTSVDAEAVRVLVDLSYLGEDDEVWVIDPTGPRAFGPYTRADHIEGGRWLATIEGDTAVLMARTFGEEPPQFFVKALSHFFRDLVPETYPKVLSCNVDIVCETNPDIQDRSAAVGLLVVPLGGGSATCSGSLINNADTPEKEPYFITANHCLDTDAEASGCEVIWDYRAATCGGDDAPPLSSLPRSDGDALLSTNATVDATLISLDSVPVGSFGRTYLGWDTREPVIGEETIGIHHPLSTAMRISYSNVEALNVGLAGYTEVAWYEGVTEPGSSGSCLLFADGNYRLTGMLSNGPYHVCPPDPIVNWDNYSSFRGFFPQIEDFLTGSTPPNGDGSCPLSVAFKDYPEILDQFRDLRDTGLMPHAWGRKLVRAYYNAAPFLADLVRRSDPARNALIAVSAPAANLY